MALALAAAPAAAAPHLDLVSGKVDVLKPGLTLWSAAAKNETLVSGEQVRTLAGGRATVVFDDQSRIELGPANSTFQVNDAAPTKVSVYMPLGFLRAFISKIAARQFNVKTPTAVCSVRGTEFTVNVNAQGHTFVQMFSGVLAVADGLGNETLIKNKQGIPVTDKGLGKVQESETQQTRVDQRKDHFKELARRELGFDLSKEAIQAAAAAEAKKAVYEQGKAIIDVNGNRVRIEEYIVRPSPTEFKLVVLNERANSFNFFWYHGAFNTTLPDDLSLALRQLPGCIGSACPYFLKSFDTGRSNMIDNMLEVSKGGHQIDVNNDGVAADAVRAAFDSKLDQFIPLNVPNLGGAGNQSFFQTLFDYNTLTFNGVPHGGWVPANPAQAIVNGGAGIPNMGAAINTGAVLLNINDPTTQASPATLTTVQNPPTCGPPNCTYNEAGVEHSVVYSQNLAGTTWDKYDSYIISDQGKVAGTADFAGVTSGTAYKQTLLNWNFEQIVTASEFQGRSIDLAVAPKVFIQSGLIQ